MISRDLIAELWSFLSKNKKMQEKYVDMQIEDPEERILQFVCQTLFLLSMDIKKERDQAIRKLCERNANPPINLESRSREGKDNRQIEEVILSSQSSSDSQTYERLNTKMENEPLNTKMENEPLNTKMENEPLNTKMENERLDTKMEIEPLVTKVENKPLNTKMENEPLIAKMEKAGPEVLPPLDDQNSKRERLKAKKKADKNYRSLSKTSPRNKNGLLDSLVDDESKSHKILAPETMSLDENVFYVNRKLRNSHATQTFFVPETMLPDSYGEADFFESEVSTCPVKKVNQERQRKSNECASPDFFESEVSAEKEVNQESLREGKHYASPDIGSYNAADYESERSPVIGKKMHTTPKAYRKPEADNVLKSLDFSSPPKEHLESESTPGGRKAGQKVLRTPKVCKKKLNNMPEFETPTKEPLKNLDTNSPTECKKSEKPSSVEILTEDLDAGNIIPMDTSTPRYSPMQFTRQLSPPVSDSSFTSPSLLPSIKDSNMMPPKEASKPEVNARSLRKRSVSAMNAGPSKENARTLRRHQTEGKAGKRTYDLSFEPPDPAAKKKYKQARIFDMPLVPKTDVVKLTGGVRKMSYDDEVTAALRASLKTKELEDMRRKEKGVAELTPIEEEQSKHEEKSLYKTKEPESSRKKSSKSPQKTPTKLSLSLKRSSPRKTSVTPSKSLRSPAKHSPRKTSKSPAKSLRSPARHSPRKPLSQNKHEINFSNKEKNSESRPAKIIQLDEILERLDESPAQESSKVCKENSTETSSSSKSKRNCQEIASSENEKRKDMVPFFEDSFDVLPKPEELNFAHQGNVVRNKAARNQMKGWSCKECKNYYEGKNLSPEKLQAAKDRCSRHRSNYNPVTNTPEGFWNPLWEDQTLSATEYDS